MLAVVLSTGPASVRDFILYGCDQKSDIVNKLCDFINTLYNFIGLLEHLVKTFKCILF